MSHLKERKEKTCLNCQAALYGRFCHQCGQENLEPKETFGHLVLHFFNDVTHFDGKFFSTVKYLLRRPGFLSREYTAGRRASYLNPIRMYVFSSALFFILFFSIKGGGKSMIRFEANAGKPEYMGLAELAAQKNQLEKTLARVTDPEEQDETREQIGSLGTQMAVIRGKFGDTTTRKFDQFQRTRFWMEALADSVRLSLQPADRDRFSRMMEEEADSAGKANFMGLHEGRYKRVSFYDSAQAALPPVQRDGWFKRKIMREVLASEEQFGKDQHSYLEHLQENFLHFFPRIFFFSLPFFALILRLVYIRRKDYYYVDHGIFTIHLYSAIFVLMTVLLLVNGLFYLLDWKWTESLFQAVDFGLIFYMLLYLYLAMLGFYKQGKGKTFLKYLLVSVLAIVLNGCIALLFLVISALLVKG